MRTPLSTWDQPAEDNDDYVWSTRLDGRYLVEVQRRDQGSAILCVFDHAEGDALIHNEEVTLAFGALFGPDAGDVATWQDRVADVVDNPDKRSVLAET